MKKISITFGLCLILLPVWVALDGGNEAIAISGCCKKRESNSSPWRKLGTDLERCKVENRNDNDNVFKKSGLVWWDMAC